MRKFLILFSLFVAIATPTYAAGLNILSWNIFMLPKPIKSSLQKIRTAVIAEQLSDSSYDLMFFQEAFTEHFRDELVKALGGSYPHQYYLKRGNPIFPVFGSGVFVMSRRPFKVLDKVYYKKCAEADCFASKGAVLIETTLASGKTVQFAPTHLQAGEGEDTGAIRLQQLTQLKRMLLKHVKPGVPQIIMGDLNIDVVEPEFQSGLKIMDMAHTNLVGPVRHTNGLQNECYKNPGKHKEWVDHFWISRQSEVAESAMQVRVFEFEHKGKTCPSSDHHAIEAHYSFR